MKRNVGDSDPPQPKYDVVYPSGLKPADEKRIFEKLSLLLGSENVSNREVDKIAYSRDYWLLASTWMIKGKVPALPDFIVWPENTEQVSKLLKLANREKIPIIPFGEGSGVVGGAVPVQGGIIVDMKKMNKIVKIDATNLLVTVQPGINGMTFERALNDAGFTCGHIPQSLYCSTLGGWLASRAAGQFSTKYGKIEDIIVALEAVLPQGEIIRTKIVPRASTGPMIERLLLGSEGTLGIITEATLKIWPYPEKRTLRSYAFDNLKPGLEAVRKILAKNVYPAVVRLYDQLETERHFQEEERARGKCLLILLMEGAKELVELEEKISHGTCLEEGGIECGEDPVQHWLKTRFNVTDASIYLPQGFVGDTIEVAVTWDKGLNLYDSMIKAMRETEGVFLASAHASHFYPQGICFYFIFGGIPAEGVKPEEFFTAVWDNAMKTCLDAGGTISHHHGVGLVRAKWLKEELGEAFNLLKRIKKALDPNNIMNPGKMGLEK